MDQPSSKFTIFPTMTAYKASTSSLKAKRNWPKGSKDFRRSLPSFFLLLFFSCIFFFPFFAYAQNEVSTTATISPAPLTTTQIVEKVAKEAGGEEKAPNMITMVSVLAGVALLPFAIMLLTSFVKIIIVLSLLRNALGVQQSPPNQALNGIALLMTIYVMFPTGLAMYNSAKEYIQYEVPKELFSKDSAFYLINVIEKAKEPMRNFLVRNMTSSHQRNFFQLAQRSFPKEFQADLKVDDFIVLVPAFITSQIKGAFEIGVLIYLPFFVIDLVTSNILLAMGMMMLSPLTIALPLKLLLIVMTDGWTLIIQGLVLTYK